MTTEGHGAVRRFWQGFQRGRRAFRRWRRGRPFWAGVFLILGGLQLFLSTQLNLGDIEISFGPQGFLAVLLPVMLLLCGSLVWATPQHRLFYSVIGSVTAVYSLLGLNLGGWFLGMLFGVIGGALGISWAPVTPKPPAVQEPPEEASEAGQAAPPYLDGADERPTEDLTGPLFDEPPGTDQTAPVRAPRQDPRTYVAAALPLLLAAVLAAPVPATQICVPLIFCPDPPAESPAPTPSPEPEPGPSGEPGPAPSPGPTDPGGEPGDPTDPTPTPTPSLTPIPTLPPPPGHPLVSSQPALMTADRLEQQDFLFEGITELPTADGGSIRVLQFSFSRATATNFSLTTTGEGQPARVTADPLVLAGDVKFYTDRFNGNALGALPLELTPDSPIVNLLELVDIPLPVFFTDVNLNLVFTNGAELTATGFLLTLP